MLSNNTKAKKIATEAVMKLLVDNGIDVRIISDEEADRLIRHHNDAYKQIVYHGSGQTFDSFDFSHMGEGEGNQTFGWGGYVTEVEGIGKTYAKMNNNSLRRNRIEYEISRLTQSLPFRRGEAKREGEIELRQWKEELAKFDGEDKSLLYTVSIPNDNGKNYLDWTGHPSKDLLDTLAHLLLNEGWEQANSVNGLFRVVRDGNNIVLNERQSGADLYAELSEALGSDKEASKLLYDAGLTGIVYPTNTLSGGNTNGTRNYVIFKEDDMRILDMVQLMRTGDSTIYGFSVGNKIYLTEEGINPETPIHEYTHLWAKAMMLHNKEAWSSVKEKLKTSPVWEEVMSDKSYESIKNNEDEIASEVLSRISGRHNSQYFVQEAEKAQSASNLLDAMRDLWKWVGNTLFDKKNFDDIEDITNTVLYDLLNNTDLKLDYAHRQTIHVLSTSNYEDVRPLAHGIKDRDTESINTAARKISDMLIHLGNPDEYVLVPMPSHLGYATYTTDMARIISKRTGIKYMNILSGEPHEPFYDKKLQEGLSSIKPIKFKTNDNIPRDKKIILIDNVLDTGTTAVSASRAFGREVYMAVLGNTANSKQFPYDIDITQGLDSLYNKVYTEEERNIISEAKAAGTYLLAPNGQPTNLTPKQWVQVRTEAFKQWFGDWGKDPYNSSRIVDANGEPKVVYHGSRTAGFTVFDSEMGDIRSMAPQGSVWFTDTRENAYSYAGTNASADLRNIPEDERDKTPGIYECFLNIRNPWREDYQGATWQGDLFGKYELIKLDEDNKYVQTYFTHGGEYFKSEEEAREYAEEYKFEHYEIRKDPWIGSNVNVVADEVMDNSYGDDNDGVIIERVIDNGHHSYGDTEGTDYVVWNTTQIKSATQNTGQFMSDEEDIRFQIIGPMGARALDLAMGNDERINAARLAMKMEKQGKDNTTIWRATGWERGTDGIWRYEIPSFRLDPMFDVIKTKTSTRSINNTLEKIIGEGMTLDKTITGENGEQPDLFKAYPSLRDVKIIKDKNRSNSGVAAYNRNSNTIIIRNASSYRSLMWSLTHEIQHAIQNIEGFTGGYSVGKYNLDRMTYLKDNDPMMYSMLHLFGYTSWANLKRCDKKDVIEAVQKYPLMKMSVEEMDQGTKKTYDNINYFLSRLEVMSLNEWHDLIAAAKKEQISIIRRGNEIYKNIAGEVEAINAEDRMFFKDDEEKVLKMRETPLSETEEIPRAKQITSIPYDGIAALNHKEDNTNTFVMGGNYILSDQERLLVSQITADLQTGRYLLTERSQQYQDVMEEIHICHDKLVSNPQKWITPREKAILSAELEMYHDGAKDLEDYFGIPEYLTTGVLGANNLTAVEMSEFAQKFARHEISFNNEGTLAKNTFMSFLYQTTIDIKNGVNLTERQKETISEIISNMEVGIYEFSEELGIEVSAINNALAINKTERIDTIDNDDFRNALKEYDFTDEKLYLLANAIDLKYSYTRPENMHNPYLDNNGDFVGDEDFRSFVRNHEQDILDFHREKMAEIHDSIRNSRPLSNAERQIFARDLYTYKNTSYFTNNNISRNDAYSALFGDDFKGNDIYPGTVSGRYMIEAQVLSSTTYALYDISTGKTFYEIDTVALPFLSGIIQENIRNQEFQTGKEPTRIVGSIYSGKPTLSTYTFAESEAIQEEILKETKNIRESYNIQGIIFGEYGGIVNLDELDRSEGQDKDIVLRTRWLVPIENNFTYDNTRVIKKLEDQGFAVTNDFSKNTPTLIPSFVEFDNEDEAKAFVKEVLNLIIDTEKQNNEPFTEEYENYLNWMNGTKDEPMTMENSIVNTIPERVSFDTKEDLEAYITDYCNEHGWDADLNHIDVSRITDMTMLFAWSNFNGDISQWDVSNVTNMDNMFFSSNFNGDISQWDTSNVSNMRGMFSWSKFNGDISKWDVSKVSNMSHMFEESSFNGDISKWNTSNVTNMESMFAYAKFTGDISKWKIQPNTYTEGMLKGTDREGYERELKPLYMPERVSFDTKTALKAYIISYCNEHGWDADLNHIDVSKITDMSELFMDTEFNGDISKWDTSNVTNMNTMFAYSDFDGDISQWNVSKVTNMSYMFECSRFNGDISKWDVSNVTNMEGMFINSNFNGDISDWDVFNVTNMYEMFMNSHFNQPIYNWDVSKVTDMNNMFAYAKFMGDISNWKIQPNTYTEGMFEGTDREGYEREFVSSYQEYITFEEQSMETLGLSKSQLYLLGKAQQIVSYNNGEIEIPEIKVGFAANPYLSYSGIIYDKFEDFARENKDMLLRYVNYIDSRSSAVSREELLPLAEYIQTLKYQLARNHNNTFNTIDEQDYAQIGEDGRHGLLTTNEDIKLVKGPFYELLPENLKVYVDAYLNMIQQYVPMYPASPAIDIEGENLNAVIYRTCRDNYDKCSKEWIEFNDEVTFVNNYQEQEATKYGKYIMTFLKDGQSVHIPQLEDGTISRKGNNLYVTTEDESYRIYPVNGNAEAAIRAGHKFFEHMVTGVITNPERQIILASKDESPLTLNTPDWDGIHSLSIIGKDENGRMFTNEDYYYYDLKGHYIDLSADDYMTLLSAVIHEKDSGEHLLKEREAYSEIMGYLYNPLGLNENNGTTQINVVPLLQFPYISIPYANKMQALGEYQLVYDQDNSRVNVLPTDNFDRHLPEMPLMQVYRKNLNDLQRISKFIMARDVLKSMGSYTQITWDKPVKLAEEYTLYGIKQTSLEQFEVLHETPNGAKIINLNDIPYSVFINMETAVKNKVQELDNTPIELMPKGCIRIDTVLTERSDDRAIYDIVANGDTIGSFASTNKEEQSIANGEYTATMLAGQKIKMIYRMNNPFEYLMSTDYEQAHTHNYESLNKLHDEIEKYYRYNSISLKEHEAASVNSFKHFGNDFVFNRFASTPIRDEKDMAPIDHYQKALNGLTPYQRMFYYEHYLTSENMPVIDNQENEIRKLYSSILSFGIVNADMLNESEKTIMRTLENIKTEGDLQKWAAEVRYTGTLDFSETTPQDIKENIRILGNTIYNADDETLRGIYDDCTMERDSNAILRSRAMSVINQYSHQKELHPEDLILFRNGMGFSVFFDDAKAVNEATGWNVTSDTDSGLYLINITTDGYEALAEKDLNLRVVTPAWSIRPIAEMYNNEYISYLQTVDNSLKDLDGVHSTYTNPIEIGDTQITRLYFGQNGIIGEDEMYGGQINIRDIANKSFNFLLIDKIAQGINNGLYNNMGKAENTDIQLSIGESKPVVKDDVSRLVTETLIHSLNKAGIKVNYATQSDIRAAVLDASGNIAFEGKDKKSLMRDGDSMVFGWVSNGEIYLTEEGMNPETPIHEYTHLWAAALEDKNPILWNHIKGLVRETPIWEEVLSDDNYSNIRDEENRIASEVLARISGRENSKKLIDSYGNDVKEPQNIIDRLTEAMEKFWNWVSTTMFGYSNMHSIEEITDRILYDLVGGTPLDLADSREFQIQKVNQPERVSFDTKEVLKAYIIGYCNEHGWDADLNHIDVSKITDMSYLFSRSKFDGDISQWDTSNVTNMCRMFSWSDFNGDISDWNVSNVTNMSYMFEGSRFDGDISQWDTSNVTNMRGMFFHSIFNDDISGWNVSNVTDNSQMFAYASFTGDIRNWKIQPKTNTERMFEGTDREGYERELKSLPTPERVSFDNKEDLNAYITNYCNEHGWDADLNHIDVSKITDMSELFMNMDFTGDISKWNTSNVTNMEGMFSWSKFNGDVSGWNVSNVKDMSYMFASSNFNQPIGNWDVSSVIVAKGMFEDSQMNHLPNEWKLSKDADITSMFKGTPLEGREEELQKKTDTPKVSEAQAENTSNNLNSNNMAEETKKTKEPDRSFELTGKELQKYLLSEALERAKTNDGVWFNPKHHGSPTMYPKMDTEINAFNVLMMTLYTDHKGYRTNMFTTFNDAKNNGFGILTGQKSLPYNWYTWDNYVNKFNPNQSISTKEYKALPDEEKVLYKAVPKKDQRAVFNIEQTSMYKAKQEEFKTVVEKDKDSIAHEYYSTLAHKMSYKEAYEELRQRPDRPENEVIVFEKDKFMYLLNEDAGIASKITGLATNDKVAYGLGVDNALRVLSKDHAMLFSKLLANNYKVNIQDAPSKIDVSNKANEIINKFKEKSDSFINTVTSQMGVKQVVNPTITTPVSYECDTDRIVSRSMKVTGASQIENINDTYKALVAATGCTERLNRARTFDTDDKYEQLVREVSAAALMSRDGFSGQLSKSNIDNIDYWKREIIEDDHLLDRLERDVNNVIQVIDKLSIGRAIDYVRMRGDKTEAQLDKRYYSVTEALEKMVDADTREVVVITDKANKSAYVILPQGASLEKNNELPGMNKNRFALALNKQGFEEVKFFNAGGALGIRQPNNFYNDKEITVSKLKQYELNTIKEIDVTEEISRTNKIEIDKVIALKDDNGKWALYVKPTNKPSFTVYPETGDLSLFFKAMKSGDAESFNKIREDIGQKYASLVEARPELKAKILEIDSSDFDLSRISRVSISKDRNNSKVLVIYAEIDGKKMEPRTLDPVQTQRFWLVDDKTGYKVSLAAQLFGPELKVTKTEEQKTKPYYFNVAYIQDSDSLKSLDELLGKDKKAFITEISNYDQGDGIELNAVTKTTKTSGHSSVVAENENYVITRDNAAGGDYAVLRKVTEEEVRAAIDRYGLSSDATDDAKSLAYQMTQEKFDNMKAQPIIEMPNGAVLYFQYNKETNNIEVGTTTNAGLKVDHTFEYDNSQSLDYNIQGVVEELNEMEEYQEEEQEEEQEETRGRRSGIRL